MSLKKKKKILTKRHISEKIMTKIKSERGPCGRGWEVENYCVK
jgi:hypothetical protein